MLVWIMDNIYISSTLYIFVDLPSLKIPTSLASMRGRVEKLLPVSDLVQALTSSN